MGNVNGRRKCENKIKTGAARICTDYKTTYKRNWRDFSRRKQRRRTKARISNSNFGVVESAPNIIQESCNEDEDHFGTTEQSLLNDSLTNGDPLVANEDSMLLLDSHTKKDDYPGDISK